MPRDKDLKRLVRARMKKTGEAYTAARAQVLRKPRSKPAARTTSAPARPAPASLRDAVDFATLAGMSDAIIRERTGRTWDGWVQVLDEQGAAAMPHRDIARLVSSTYHIPGWWTQTVTVGYERIKGLRARGQRRDGTYEANKSRTFDVTVQALFDAWADEGVRGRWLHDANVKVRTASAPKSMRLGWSDGSIVAVGFMTKARSRSAVAVQHTKLPDRESADRMKRYWTERLDALAETLAER